MRPVTAAEILSNADFVAARPHIERAVLRTKESRRVAVGPNLTLLFENRETVLYQIQEMARTERIVDDAKLQEEIDAYAALLPDEHELSATLFIEIPGIAMLPPAEARMAVNRFQGIDDGVLFLELGKHRIPARFEGGHSKEEKLAAVQYIRFALQSEAKKALADLAQPARLTIGHPRYEAEQALGAEVRQELLRDLA